jgi:hypothetical protein
VNIRRISLQRSNITRQHHPILNHYQPDMVCGSDSISTLLLTDPRGAYGGQDPSMSNKSGSIWQPARAPFCTPASLPPIICGPFGA